MSVVEIQFPAPSVGQVLRNRPAVAADNAGFSVSDARFGILPGPQAQHREEKA